MTEKGAQMAPQSKATPQTASNVDATAAPDRPGEDFRREWAKFNGVDPSEMREIHALGGWVDRFDGRGWVQEGGGY